MDLVKHANLFNRIAFAYKWFFKSQVKFYSEIILNNISELQINEGDTILDIGCGTGAFAFSFKKQGYDVTGVDFAFSMIKEANKKKIRSITADAVAGLPFRDKSFDYVVSAFVAHGLSAHYREKLFLESSRLARKYVLYHDFNRKRRFFIDLIETLEGGSYFSFIKNGQSLMKDVFKDVNIINVTPNNAWYICRP